MLPNRRVLLDCIPPAGVAAEIGVAFGDFTAEILERARPARLHLVDVWDTKRYESGLEQIRETFGSEIDDGRIVIDRGLSVEVLPRFADASLDWVYIDTDHSYETTFAELVLCDRKVKAGGIIAGHDFVVGNVVKPVVYGVIPAVAKFCVDYGWKLAFLTVESRGNGSFALSRLP